MAIHLDQILASTRQAVAARKAATPWAELESRAALHMPRGLARALRSASATRPAIIAELKKASPSKGLIRPGFDVEVLAHSLEAAGAAALSVLTEEAFFQGGLPYLQAASAQTWIPCLRKDFIVDEYQIIEARAYRADAILLIAAALTDAELQALIRTAHQVELDVLCEVHTALELERVLQLKSGSEVNAIGVNNRDLRSFETRLETSLMLGERLPASVVRVAESGIQIAADLKLLRAAGYDAFLIGESLMRQADPGAGLAELLAAAGDQSRGSNPQHAAPEQHPARMR